MIYLTSSFQNIMSFVDLNRTLHFIDWQRPFDKQCSTQHFKQNVCWWMKQNNIRRMLLILVVFVDGDTIRVTLMLFWKLHVQNRVHFVNCELFIPLWEPIIL